MTRPRLVIDARPRGPDGPLASAMVGGRPVLGHLVELASGLGGPGAVRVHARPDEHARLRALMAGAGQAFEVDLVPGPPPENAVILRADRLYDPARLGRAVRRGRDPESAVLWRLDRPHALAGAADELIRRRTYQPIGRFWALGPARGLARLLRPTPVRPNAVTLAASGLFLAGAVLVAFGGGSIGVRAATAALLALALVLDTADGHLARLQGTASDFGRWLDGTLDEVGDMALHGAAAWAAFARGGGEFWLVVGMAYGMGKYVFAHANTTWPGAAVPATPGLEPASAAGGRLREIARLAGHADVRWHLWIVLALLGRLDAALAAYAAYYPARALAGAWRKAVRGG